MGILNKYKRLRLPDDDKGKRYLNIAKYSDSPLGRILAPSYGYAFDTLIGRIGNIRIAMDYIVKRGYPKRLLNKSKLTRKDIESVSKIKNNVVPNYWAILTYIVAVRIQSDINLIKEIKDLDSDIELTSYNVFKNKSLGVVAQIKELNIPMCKYVAILRLIFKLIQNDHFTDTSIKQLIQDTKDNPALPLFDNVPFAIESEL